ncbi:Protein of unknown function [Gryllus bimaculatus]|nr:Protein of unknown function [Gryllus bimaculatus]
MLQYCGVDDAPPPVAMLQHEAPPCGCRLPFHPGAMEAACADATVYMASSAVSSHCDCRSLEQAMSGVVRPTSGEAMADALQLMTRALERMQEAMSLQDKRMEEARKQQQQKSDKAKYLQQKKFEEALRLQEQKANEREEEFAAQQRRRLEEFLSEQEHRANERLEEAVSLQQQLREAMRLHEQRTCEREEALRALQERSEAVMRAVEDKVEQMHERMRKYSCAPLKRRWTKTVERMRKSLKEERYRLQRTTLRQQPRALLFSALHCQLFAQRNRRNSTLLLVRSVQNDFKEI